MGTYYVLVAGNVLFPPVRQRAAQRLSGDPDQRVVFVDVQAKIFRILSHQLLALLLLFGFVDFTFFVF